MTPAHIKPLPDTRNALTIPYLPVLIVRTAELFRMIVTGYDEVGAYGPSPDLSSGDMDTMPSPAAGAKG